MKSLAMSMNRWLLSLTTMMLLYSQSSAQYTKADSISVFFWINKADAFFNDGKNDSAFFYCARAQSFSKEKNFKRGQAHALIEEAAIYIDNDELDKADEHASSIYKLGVQLKDSLVTAVSWMCMAQVRMYKEQFAEAISLFTKCLQYYLENHPSRYSALAFNDLGYTWGRTGELNKQAICLIKSIGIYEKYFPEDYGELGVAYSNLSTVYYSLNDRPKAIDYAKKSLGYRERSGDMARLSIGCCNISQFYLGVDNEEAEKYLGLCVKYALLSKQEQRIVHSYVTASSLFMANKKYSEALEYEEKVIAELERSKRDVSMLARRYISAAILNEKLEKDSSVVLGYYRKSKALLLQTEDKVSLRDFYVNLSNYYGAQKNYAAAYENYKLYGLYRDSIISDKTAESIAEVTTRHESEKKDNEIIRLNTTQRIKELEIEKQKALLAGNAASALQKQNEIDLLFKNQELQHSRIRQQEEELIKQGLLTKNRTQQFELIEKENQLHEKQLKSQKVIRNLLIVGLALLVLFSITWFNRYHLKRKLEQQKSLLTMRNNISRDLHDDIGASLSNINILNELARRNINQPEKSSEYLSKASEDIQRISESLADIVWNINPRYDELQNLFIRMKRYAADMLDGKNIEGEFDFPSSEGLEISMTQRRDLYLIFKEAVNNLAKYSEASKAVIRINTSNGQLQMLVRDNGKGFDITNHRSGNGLQNMEQRAKNAGATVAINSVPGEGTSVQLEMPLV